MKLDNHQIILVDKPQGITSFGVVAKVRYLLSQQLGKKAKVGHTGTLDPFATGLMILVTGEMCKQASRFSKLDKSYRAEIVLGKVSSTADVEGKLRFGQRVQPSRATLEAVLGQFTGVISQRPPMFSAIKINGQRAYQLARQGQEVAVPERQVTIYELQLLSYNYPRLVLEVKVSSGTYIRSLAVDIGRALGTGAYCQALRRLTIADYDVDQAQQLPLA